MSTDRPDDEHAIEQALRASRTLLDAPEALIQRVIDAWPATFRAAPPAAPTLRQRLQAVLGFDSASVPQAALGLRSGATATRQLLYSCEGRDIDLRLSPQPSSAPEPVRWRVSGQVLGPDQGGFADLHHGSDVRTVAWNQLAEFSFDDVPDEPCTLVLRGDDWELELPPIEMRSTI